MVWVVVDNAENPWQNMMEFDLVVIGIIYGFSRLIDGNYESFLFDARSHHPPAHLESDWCGSDETGFLPVDLSQKNVPSFNDQTHRTKTALHNMNTHTSYYVYLMMRVCVISSLPYDVDVPLSGASRGDGSGSESGVLRMGRTSPFLNR